MPAPRMTMPSTPMPAAAAIRNHRRQPSNGVAESAFSRRMTPIMAARTRANTPLDTSFNDDVRAAMVTGAG